MSLPENFHELELRFVYGHVLNELISRNKNVYCLEADLSKASGTNPLVLQEHPANFINAGVAEANMLGLAAGLAVEGKIPFCATFCSFASRRIYDQITISVAYADTNVKIVGTGPGITQGPNGGTHMCFQDLAIMRAMPNIRIFSPCDAFELRAVLHFMAAHYGGMYLQLLRMKHPAVFDADYVFEEGKAKRLAEGNAVTLITTGYTTHLARPAVLSLQKDGIAADWLHCPCIKPFPVEDVVASAKKTGTVVTVENQNIIGGLGGAVCETLAEHYPVYLKRLGVPDKFGEIASEEYLLNKHGFNTEHIISACKESVQNKGKSK
ncbi:MAG: transketolase family protein [Planctomycetaceae bacterium]|jgi:transketolase|nr:transketolase family protein [Planctomycetaceae bacterium]